MAPYMKDREENEDIEMGGNTYPTKQSYNSSVAESQVEPKTNSVTDASEKPPELEPPFPIVLKFANVVYSVTIKPQKSWWNPKKCKSNMKTQCVHKEILHGVSGVVRPGEMLVMLGPSGSGKTTLLKVLGGRLKAQGEVLYNDQPHTKAVKRRTGFVTQDDVLFPHLTVKETLVYAAMLRLPKTFTPEQKVRRAESIIEELGLERCINTIIGNTLLRGVSGGERKRVSIGHEMLVDPSLLLLDEPTSGLDSTTALRIIRTLQGLANSGKTIVTTIHQPSSTVYHMFDKMILLSEGHLLYYGRGRTAMEYFASVGFTPSYATNPADFLLDLACGVSPQAVVAEGGNMVEIGHKNQTQDPKLVLQKLIEAYKSSNLAEEVKSLVDGTHAPVGGKFEKGIEMRKWPNSWFDQFKVLIERGWKERRHEAFAGLKIGQVLVISFICGLLWWK